MKSNLARKMTLTAVALAVTAMSSQTHAQQKTETGLALEELVVTARKREETLIDAPLAITVFGKQELESAGYTDIIEVSKATPGLFIEDFNESRARVNTTPRFRGVFFTSGSRLQQTATIFLDGVYLSGGEQTIGVNELERVEIIKGPQSALFGRNTFAGAINYVTKDPSEEFRADIDITAASEGEYRVAAGLEGSIANGVTGRISANFAKDEGDYDNFAVPGERLGDEENYAVNGTLVFTPNDRTRFKVRASYREVDDGTPAFVAAAGIEDHNFGGFLLNNGVANRADSVVAGPRDGTRTESVFAGTVTIPNANRIGINSGADSIARFRNGYLTDGRFSPEAAVLDFSPLEIDEFGLKLDSFRLDIHADFDLTDNVSLSILGGFNEESYGYFADFDNGPDDSFLSFISQDIEDKSLELRLSGTSDKLGWSIGASYVDIDIESVNGTFSFFGPTIAFAYMRLDSQAWDTGGIYDINIRARDLDAAASKLRRIGWQAKAPVNQFSFGPFVVKEWIVRSPDGFELALIERIKPELKGWPLMKAMSRSFNSTQIVKDMSTSMHFYEKVLGFQRYLEHKGASKVAGPNVLGMPQNSARQVEREIYILSPDKSNEGSIELLQFHGLDGADYSQTSHFPNLGIGLLRLPVENIEALQVHLIENQVEFIHRVKTLGSEKKMVVKAPEGAWLEFYESAEND